MRYITSILFKSTIWSGEIFEDVMVDQTWYTSVDHTQRPPLEGLANAQFRSFHSQAPSKTGAGKSAKAAKHYSTQWRPSTGEVRWNKASHLKIPRATSYIRWQMIRFSLINVFLALCQIAPKNMKWTYQIIGWWCFWIFTPELFMLQEEAVLNLLPLLFFNFARFPAHLPHSWICDSPIFARLLSTRAHIDRESWWKKNWKCVSHAFIKRPLWRIFTASGTIFSKVTSK